MSASYKLSQTVDEQHSYAQLVSGPNACAAVGEKEPSDLAHIVPEDSLIVCGVVEEVLPIAGKARAS